VIKAIKFASIPTRNQDSALEFWTTRVGFQVATDQPFDDTQRWIELRIPGADTGVVLFTPTGHEDRIGGFMNMAFTADESCGKCTPCRVGSVRGREILERIQNGQGIAEDLILLSDLGETMKTASLCALGGRAPYPGSGPRERSSRPASALRARRDRRAAARTRRGHSRARSTRL